MREGMLAGVLCECCKLQHARGILFTKRDDRLHAWATLGEGASFVEDSYFQVSELLECDAALEEHAVLSALAHADHDGGGRG